MNSLPKTATRQRRGCDLKPGPSALKSSMLTTRYQATPLNSSLSKKFLESCFVVSGSSCRLAQDSMC